MKTIYWRFQSQKPWHFICICSQCISFFNFQLRIWPPLAFIHEIDGIQRVFSICWSMTSRQFLALTVYTANLFRNWALAKKCKHRLNRSHILSYIIITVWLFLAVFLRVFSVNSYQDGWWYNESNTSSSSITATWVRTIRKSKNCERIAIRLSWRSPKPGMM